MNTLYLFLAVLLSSTSYTLVRGGACERAAILLQIAAFAAGFAWRSKLLMPTIVALPIFTIDAILLAAFTTMALLANRFWTIWLAGFQCAAVIVHVAKAVEPAMMPQGYGILEQFWAYPMLTVTVLASFWHSARRATGPDRPWRHLASVR